MTTTATDPNKDLIVYVDTDGTPTGETAAKLDAHTATTRLHSAFSCYIFNDNGEFLVTQRAHEKKVWPDVWTNSVCGHPAPEEARTEAIIRRAQFELGMEIASLQEILPTYTYKTPPYNGIIEHEFCPVFVALAASKPQPNPAEVQAVRWISWDEFVATAEADTDDVWSWWCKDQLKQLSTNAAFKDFLARFKQV